MAVFGRKARGTNGKWMGSGKRDLSWPNGMTEEWSGQSEEEHTLRGNGGRTGSETRMMDFRGQGQSAWL